MKSKFLVCAFVLISVSSVDAMSSKKETRRPEDNPLLSMTSEGDQDFNQHDYTAGPSQSAGTSRESRAGKKPSYRYQSYGENKEEAARRMVCEALKAMEIANPDTALVEGVYNYQWPYDKLPPCRRLPITNFSDISMTTEGDVKELEFVAYQKAIQWHIEHGDNEYAPKGIKKHINRIAMAYMVGGCVIFIGGIAATGILKDRGLCLLVGLVIGGTMFVRGFFGLIDKEDKNEATERLNLDSHTAQILCANNKADIVKYMIDVVHEEDLNNPVPEGCCRWLDRYYVADRFRHNLRLKRQAALQQVLDEHVPTLDV